MIDVYTVAMMITIHACLLLFVTAVWIHLGSFFRFVTKTCYQSFKAVCGMAFYMPNIKVGGFYQRSLLICLGFDVETLRFEA